MSIRRKKARATVWKSGDLCIHASSARLLSRMTWRKQAMQATCLRARGGHHAESSHFIAVRGPFFQLTRSFRTVISVSPLPDFPHQRIFYSISTYDDNRGAPKASSIETVFSPTESPPGDIELNTMKPGTAGAQDESHSGMEYAEPENKPSAGQGVPNASEIHSLQDMETEHGIQPVEDARPDAVSRATQHSPGETKFDLKVSNVEFSDEEREKAWKNITNAVEKYSDEMVEQWNKEIDGLLTFAGLFSAILSAFNVQSYSLLQPSASDQTNAVLQQISNQIASLRVFDPFVNSTQPAYSDLRPSPSAFQAPTYAIWVNTLWFVSLVFSLASATIGIIVKQWIKEYNTGLYGSSREVGRRRQYRIDSLEKWHVAEIVAIIPLLLLIAVILFLAGLIILLYNIHGTVASITAAFIGLLLLFVTATTVGPTLSKSCCFYSPQAYVVFCAWAGMVRVYRPIALSITRVLYKFFEWTSDHGYFCKSYARFQDLNNANEISKHTEEPIVWRAGEQTAYKSNSVELDANTMITVYSTTVDSQYICDSIAYLSGSYSYDLWDTYLSKLIEEIPLHGTLQKLWPSADKYSLLSTFVMYAERMLLNLSRIDDDSPETFSALYKLVEPDLRTEHDYVQLPDKGIALRVLCGARRGRNALEADTIWSTHVFPNDLRRVQNPVTYGTVAAAAAHRLHGIARAPAVRPSCFEYGVVDWDLNFVRQHISVIRQLLEHSQADSGPDWYPAISPVVAHAFDSIRTILRNLDMKAAGRSLWSESTRYKEIVESVETVSNGRYGSTFVTPSMVEFLRETFLRLIGSSDSPDPDIDKCICILMSLEYKLPNAHGRFIGANERLINHFTYADATKVRDPRTYQAVASAIAYRLNLITSSLGHGVGHYDLDFIQRHIKIMRQLLEHPQAESGPDWFLVISPVVANAFDSIGKMLGNLYMQATYRRTFSKSIEYRQILEHVESISNCHCSGTLITSVFVGSLVDTFSRLVGGDDWKNTRSDNVDVRRCKDILIRLESKFPSASTRPAQPGAPPASGPSKASASHQDQTNLMGVHDEHGSESEAPTEAVIASVLVDTESRVGPST